MSPGRCADLSTFQTCFGQTDKEKAFRTNVHLIEEQSTQRVPCHEATSADLSSGSRVSTVDKASNKSEVETNVKMKAYARWAFGSKLLVFLHLDMSVVKHHTSLLNLLGTYRLCCCEARNKQGQAHRCTRNTAAAVH